MMSKAWWVTGYFLLTFELLLVLVCIGEAAAASEGFWGWSIVFVFLAAANAGQGYVVRSTMKSERR